MRCPEYSQHAYSVEDIPDSDFEYSGSFEVVASSQGAVLVKKKYVAHCPDCRTTRYRLAKYKLEMIPHDNLPFGEV